jgi:hypothetical protein
MLRFNCSVCERPLKCSEEKAGQNLPCPGCKCTITVPGSPRIGAPEQLMRPVSSQDNPPRGREDDDPSATKRNSEPDIEARCISCGTENLFHPSAAGKLSRCCECGETTPVPNKQQQAYAKKRKAERRLNIWIGVVCAILVMIQVGRCTYNEIQSPEHKAWMFVRRMLKSPSQGKRISSRVIRSDDDGKRVEVEFEAPNDFGAVLRDSMTVIVRPDGTVVPISN